MKKILVVALFFGALTGALSALDVYPIDKSEILAGTRFDFKVELFGVQDEAGVSLSINGKPADKILGKKPVYLTEDLGKAGQASAYLLRDVVLRSPGTYVVQVADAFGSVRSVTWTVYAPAAKAVAKSVIFLLADGWSIGTRTLDPRQETLAELIKRTTKKSIGIVTDVELQDVNSAEVVSHARIRDEKAAIVGQLLTAHPELLAGSSSLVPKASSGSKRKDENSVDLFQKAGYEVAITSTELKEVAGPPKNLLGLSYPSDFTTGDRKNLAMNTASLSEQPDLIEMTQVALERLSQNKEGFFLMVELGQVGAYGKVAATALEFAKKHPDTVVVAVGDQTHSVSVYGADEILILSTPGSEVVRAYQENTAVFKYLVKALGLKP